MELTDSYLWKDYQRSIELYPGMHKNFAAYLEFVFHVNGNGYVWSKGKLICPSPEEYSSLQEDISFNQEFSSYESEENVLYHPFFLDSPYIHENVREVFSTDRGLHQFYPLSQHSRIMNIPASADYLTMALGLFMLKTAIVNHTTLISRRDNVEKYNSPINDIINIVDSNPDGKYSFHKAMEIISRSYHKIVESR